MFKSSTKLFRIFSKQCSERSFATNPFWKGIENSDGSLTLFKEDSNKVISINKNCATNGCPARKPEVSLVKYVAPKIYLTESSVSKKRIMQVGEIVGC